MKVLNWDLRPPTVYDFVRTFCALLVPGAGGGAPNDQLSEQQQQQQPLKPVVAVTLQAKEEKEKELERLRFGAEDIADLASFGAFFFQYYFPSFS